MVTHNSYISCLFLVFMFELNREELSSRFKNFGDKSMNNQKVKDQNCKNVKLHHCCSQLPATRVSGGGGPAQFLLLVILTTRDCGGGDGPAPLSTVTLAESK